MILKVRIKGEKNGGRFDLLTVTIPSKDEVYEVKALKKVKGEITIRDNNQFGFVDGVFVNPELIKQNKLTDKTKIKGKAIMSFNKKRKEWGWKMISIK